MTNPFDDDFFNECDAEFDRVTTKAPSEFARKKFTCESCGGSGKWSGGTNKHGNAKCHTCHGLGYLVTSEADRRKQRANRRDRKARNMLAAQDANKAHGNGYLYDWLRSIRDWNTFADSLLIQHAEGKAWSEKQIAACRKMHLKMKAKKEARAKEVKESEVVVDLTGIKAMFDAAVAHGYKAPKYRAEGLILSRAKDHSANPGHIYVKREDDTYAGKIDPQMNFKAGYGIRGLDLHQVSTALLEIAKDPHGAAVRYGNRTGRCACCGRELTKDESIARGIGPICAERWGLTEVRMNATKEEAKADLDKKKAAILPPPPPARSA